MVESKEITFSRKQLYDMVWKEPLSKLSKKYKISDNGLRKVCRSMKVPFPRHGYWQKVQSGKKSVKVKFIEKFDGKLYCTLFLREKDTNSAESIISPLKSLMIEIENDESLSLKVPDRLSNPDDLIIQARRSFEDKKKNWGQWGNENITSKYNGLNISVTPKSIGRVLRFMDTLIKLLKKRGHHIEISGENTYIRIYGEKIEVSLREKSKRIKTKRPDSLWFDTELKPTGKLSLKIDRYYSSEWNDGLVLIEERLVNILAKIELLGRKLQRQTIRSEIDRKIQEEQEHLEQIRIDRIIEEQDNVKDLFKEADRWYHARTLRLFINHFEEEATANKTLSENMEEYIKWVNHKIDWYDPMINASDKYLDNSFKEELQKIKVKEQSSQQYPHYREKSFWESHW